MTSELYENEDIREFEESGNPTPEALDDRDEIVFSDAIKEGHALQDMKKTPGWKIFEGILSGLLEQSYNELLKATDMKDVMRLQESVKAYRSILIQIDSRILQAKTLQEQRTREDNVFLADNPLGGKDG